MPAVKVKKTKPEQSSELGEAVDLLRVDAGRRASGVHKTKHGQYLTPMPVARFMASMIKADADEIRILDAGAGIGSLFSAAVEHFCSRKRKPESIEVVAYEIDSALCEYLADTIRACTEACDRAGVQFSAEVRREDFLERTADTFDGGLFGELPAEFDVAIQNPPYYKINVDSKARRTLQRMGIETSNIYTGFLAATVKLLKPGGELVAITPRSFCNGTYFRGFRRWFLENMAIRRIHTFESRQKAFKEDAVLQETVIFRSVRGAKHRAIDITSNAGPDDHLVKSRLTDYEKVVEPNDPEHFIRIQQDDLAGRVSDRFGQFRATLADLSVQVSTGRVVDFRAKGALRKAAGAGTVPLIYPTHFENGYIAWPKRNTKKHNALVDSAETKDVLIPNDTYVLVKRFSAKEERRRIVAAIHDPNRVKCKLIGFENHLNYFHHNGRGLEPAFARGLTAFLNSTLVDQYFRQFSGHTQVNATDLRNMKYPSREQLTHLGAMLGNGFPDQDAIDQLVSKELLTMADDVDPVQAMKRIQDCITLLKALGLPRAQLNERSSLTLLSLLSVDPTTPWSEASDPLMGITPMMEFFAKHYGKKYAPNTRETVRRQTVHQFLDAGLIVANPDRADRPVNSPKAVYQMEPGALELIRTYGTAEWEKNLKTYQASVETLKKKYAEEREMTRLPVQIAEGKMITLSPGGQNVLVQQIIEQFAPRFTPGGVLIYVGDTDTKFAHFDKKALAGLGVVLETHGKMPDVIVHHVAKNWLLLIEAVTSHGPVDAKRKNELKKMFANSKAGLVFVTTFLDRKAMIEYLDEISWETEVWVAESPTHMIHFNGERFLGPY